MLSGGDQISDNNCNCDYHIIPLQVKLMKGITIIRGTDALKIAIIIWEGFF